MYTARRFNFYHLLALMLWACMFQLCWFHSVVATTLDSPFSLGWQKPMSRSGGMNITDVANVPFNDDLIVVGRADNTKTIGFVVQEAILNSDALQDVASFGFVMLMAKGGAAKWTRVLSYSPIAVAYGNNKIFVAGEIGGQGFTSLFYMNGTALSNSSLANGSKIYDIATDPVTDVTYFTGFETNSTGATRIILWSYHDGQFYPLGNPGYGSGKNTGRYISAYNNIVTMSGTVDSSVSFNNMVLPLDAKNFIFEYKVTNQENMIRFVGSQTVAKLVVRKLDLSFAIEPTGSQVWAYSTTTDNIISFVSSSGSQGSLEIHSFSSDHPLSNILLVSGSIFGNVSVGGVMMSSRSTIVPDGFICKFLFTPSTMTPVCNVFGGDGPDIGKVVSVDSGGNIIVATSSDSINKKWIPGVPFPDSLSNQIIVVGSETSPTVLIHGNISTFTFLTNTTYVVKNSITLHESVVIQSGATVIVSDGATIVSSLYLSIQGISQQPAYIRCQQGSTQLPTIYVDTGSAIHLDHAEITGVALKVVGGRVNVMNSKFLGASSFEVRDSPIFTLQTSTFRSNRSSIPIMSLSTTDLVPTASSLIITNIFETNGTQIMNIVMKSGTLLIDGNSFIGPSQGVQLDVASVAVSVSSNRFFNLQEPLNTTSESGTGCTLSIGANTFQGCSGPVRVNKKGEGILTIRGNIFQNMTASSLLSLESPVYCTGPMSIIGNTFIDNIVSNVFVSLVFPEICSLSDFRENNITDNHSTGFDSLLRISGQVRVNRNRFQFANKSIVYNGHSVLNAQYNDWGATMSSIVSQMTGNGADITRNITVLYAPYLNSTGSVVEVQFFDISEARELIDCKSILDLWPSSPSGVYRIYPYCKSMLVYCDMTTASLVIQKRIHGTVDFNKPWTDYVTGFGELDGDFFIGLENLNLLANSSQQASLDIWGSDIELSSYVGQMQVGSSTQNYPLTVQMGPEISQMGVPFSTYDKYSSVAALNCAISQESGWWFSNCNDPQSWNLNGLYLDGIQFGSYRPLSITLLKLQPNNTTREGMMCGHCFGRSANDPLVCSGNGACVGRNICACNEGFAGPSCNKTVTVTIESIQPTKYCEDATFTAKIAGFEGDFTYTWSMHEIADMKSSVISYLSALNTANISLPARFMGRLPSIIEVEVFHNSRKVGIAHSSFQMPDLLLDNTNILIEDPHIEVRQFELYSFIVRVQNLPTCADDEYRIWSFSGKNYSTLQNFQRIEFIPVQSGYSEITLTVGPSSANVFINVTIIKVLPQAVISGGNRMVYAHKTYNISAAESRDLVVKNGTIPRFTWYCQSCNNMNPSGSLFLFNESVGTYVIVVMFAPDFQDPSRFASAQVIITVIDQNEDIPIPQIITSLSSVIDPRKRIRIEATVSKNRNNHLLGYKWLVMKNNDTKSQLTVYGDAYQVVPLVLDENYLEPNSSYSFILRVNYKNLTQYGEASVTGRTATASTIRFATCSPCVGAALDTQFELSINATDHIDSYPLQYSFSYFDTLHQRFIPLQQSSNIPTIYTVLPYLNSSCITIQGLVANFYGIESVTQFNISLIESNNTSSSLINLLSKLKDQSSSNLLPIIATSLNRIQVKNQSAIVEKVIEFMASTLDEEALNNTIITIDSLTSKIDTMEILSELQLDDNTSNITKNTHLLVDKVIGLCTRGNIELRDSPTKSLARAISNLFVQYQAEPLHTVNPILSTISKISTLIASTKLVSENQTSIATAAYQLSVKKESGSLIGGASIYTNEVEVSMPANVGTLDPQQVYTVQSISYNQRHNPYVLTYQNFSTAIVDFEIKNGDRKVKLSDMEYPLEIILKKETQYFNSSLKYECRFLDENTNSSWYTQGCWLHNEDDDSVTCHCTHTTSFSAMIIYDSSAPNKASDGLYITSIIINVMLVLISIALFCMIMLWRGKQPIRSRFLTPYIGLTAIIIECILNGIIRNSLLIAANNAKDYTGVNSIAYLILTIVNPIVLLSLFIYFWQMLRYFFLKNLYAIMDLDKRNVKKIRFLRILSSKLLYVTIGAAILISSCSYFVIISILEATNVIKPNAASAVNALSFSIMSLSIGALIVATFAWDCTIIMSRKIIRRELKKNSEGNADFKFLQKITSTVVNHFRSDDPLMFRVESIFMVSAMMIMTVSYIIGISDRFDTNASSNSAAKIIEFLFDILYISLRIMAFGGTPVIVHFIQRIRLHNENENYAKLKTYMSELKTATSTIESELQNLLRDEHGYNAIASYAKKEFALENVILWKRLEKIRMDNMTATLETRQQHLKGLYDDCIARGSPFECNLPAKVVKKYRDVLNRSDPTATDCEEIFLVVSNEVLVNICDTYTRFSVSPEYAQYMHVKQMVNELQDVGKLKYN